ncbi:nucleotide disphospho-sugar-binding domain-containing protein [Micromonospora sp. PTRAS2]
MFMVPTAWAFHTAGHDVRVACQPHVQDVVTGSGLNAVIVGPAVDFAAQHRALVDRTSGLTTYKRRDAVVDLFHRNAEIMVDDLVGTVQAWQPDLIVRDPVAFAAAPAAAVTGTPIVRHAWGPDLYATDPGIWLAHLVRERLDATCRRYSAEVPDRFAAPVIDPSPPSLRIAGADPCVPMQYVPYNGAAVLPDWIWADRTRPRVCVSWGTFMSAADDEHDMFKLPDVVRALTGLDVDIVVAVTRDDLGLAPDERAGVHVVGGLPLHVLLPTCAAIVHHGGATTMLTAARAGIPQIVIPQMFEQHLNTGLLLKTGAAVSVPSDAADPESVRTAVSAVLADPARRSAAQDLRAEILATPTPAEAIHDVVALASRHRQPSPVS